MQVSDLFPPEVIDEDIRKWMGGALAAGALAAAPIGLGKIAPELNQGPSAQDLTILAQTMWGEARGHGIDGMLAVGYVIKNRAESNKDALFGDGIQGVALKNKQFSCWNDSDPNKDRMKRMQQIENIIKTRTAPDGSESYEEWLDHFKLTKDFNDYKAWREAFKLASQVLRGTAPDPTDGAVYYHTTSVHPSWARSLEPVGKVANHIFYRLPSDS